MVPLFDEKYGGEREAVGSAEPKGEEAKFEKDGREVSRGIRRLSPRESLRQLAWSCVFSKKELVVPVEIVIRIDERRRFFSKFV